MSVQRRVNLRKSSYRHAERSPHVLFPTIRKRLDHSFRTDLQLDFGLLHDKASLLPIIVNNAVMLLRAQGGCFYFCEPGQNILRCAVSHNTTVEYRGSQLAYGEGAAGIVAQRRQPLVVNHFGRWSHRGMYAEEESISCVLSVPVFSHHQIYGVLEVFDKNVDRHFRKTDRDLLAFFANQASITIENSSLFVAERQARQRSDALREAARALTSSLSVDDVLQEVLEQLRRVLPYESCNIMLLENERLKIKVWRGYSPNLDPKVLQEISFSLDNNQTVGFVVRTCQPLAIADVKNDPRWVAIPTARQINSWLGVPLLARGECIGVINLNRHANEAYSEDDIAIAQDFAAQAATAIENARLYETETKRAAELETLRQASLGLISSLNIETVFYGILQAAHQMLIDVEHASIYLYFPENGGRLEFGAGLRWEGEICELISESLPDGLTQTVAGSAETVFLEDTISHMQITPLSDRITETMVGIPLRIGPRVVGVMELAYSKTRQLDQSEQHLLQLLSDQAAIAIENARLYEKAATNQQHLSLLYDVVRELASHLDNDQILERAITLTSQALGGNIGYAFIYIPATSSLQMRAVYGLPGADVDEFNNVYDIKSGIGLAGWVAQHAIPDISPDVTTDARWLHVPGIDDNVRSAICAPVMVGNRLLGVISVLHTQPEAFTSDHLQLLQTICQEVGLAMSNASRYQQVQRRLQEITLIQKLAQAFNRRLQVKDLLKEVVFQLKEQLGYQQIEIFLLDGNQLFLGAYCGQKPDLSELSTSRGVVGRVTRTGQPEIICDVTKDPDYEVYVSTTTSELAVPIKQGDAILGVINVESSQDGQLSTQDLDLLQVLAGQISIALENANLYERLSQHADELEHIVARRTAELVELYGLSQEISGSLSYGGLLSLLVSHLQRAVGTEVVVGGLIIDDEPQILIQTDRVLSKAGLQALKTVWSETLKKSGRVRIKPDEAAVEVVQSEEFDSTAKPLDEFLTILSTPVYAGDELAGVLIAASSHQIEIGQHPVRIMDTFASQAAGAIHRLAALLEAEQKRLESLVEHLPVGVLLIDQEYRLLLANPPALQILQEIKPFTLKEPLAMIGDLQTEDLIRQAPDQMETVISLGPGRRRIITAQARPVSAQKGQWVVTLQDVTQDRENRDRVHMQERLATVGQLAAGIAHDFNNIMAAILVYADLLADEPSMPVHSRERLAIIRQQVHRAASLIRQILDFSRRSIMDPSVLDLLPFVKELDKMLRRVIPETIQIELDYTPGVYLVNVDPTRLQQALVNLALNARDAMPDGGTLRFALQRVAVHEAKHISATDIHPGDWICISVIDNGCGIPTENLPHIFEPFYTTKPVGQGTGLGLAQVYGIVKQHSGFIDVKSQVGNGTTFTIYLQEVKNPIIQPARGKRSQPLGGAGKTVLVVEDDATTREALQILLEEHHYRVLTAGNGLEALQRLESELLLVDLVISDMVMPVMGGWDLYREIKAHWPSIKMLMVTGHPMETKSQDLLEREDVHWLQKPFSIDDLRTAINSLVDRQDVIG